MPYAERVRLPAGGLEMINEGIRVETYLRKHRKKFLISGVSEIKQPNNNYCYEACEGVIWAYATIEFD